MTAPVLNLWDLEAAIIARVQAAAPAGVLVKATFDATDWTADEGPRVGAHLVFDGIGVPDQVRTSALAVTRWTLHTYLDTGRANSTDLDNAQKLLLAGMRSVLGYEWRTGLAAQLAAGPQTGFDGRLARVSVSFTIPAPIAGLTQEQQP